MALSASDSSPINDNDNGNKMESLETLNEILPRKKYTMICKWTLLLREKTDSLMVRAGGWGGGVGPQLRPPTVLRCPSRPPAKFCGNVCKVFLQSGRGFDLGDFTLGPNIAFGRRSSLSL